MFLSLEEKMELESTNIKQVDLRYAITFSRKANSGAGGTCNASVIPGRHLSTKAVSVYCSMLLLQSGGGLIYEGAFNELIKFTLDVDTNHHFCHTVDNKRDINSPNPTPLNQPLFVSRTLLCPLCP